MFTEQPTTDIITLLGAVLCCTVYCVLCCTVPCERDQAPPTPANCIRVSAYHLDPSPSRINDYLATLTNDRPQRHL